LGTVDTRAETTVAPRKQLFYSNKFCPGRFDRSFWSSSGRVQLLFRIQLFRVVWTKEMCSRTDTSTLRRCVARVYAGFESTTLWYTFRQFSF